MLFSIFSIGFYPMRIKLPSQMMSDIECTEALLCCMFKDIFMFFFIGARADFVPCFLYCIVKHTLKSTTHCLTTLPHKRLSPTRSIFLLSLHKQLFVLASSIIYALHLIMLSTTANLIRQPRNNQGSNPRTIAECIVIHCT